LATRKEFTQPIKEKIKKEQGFFHMYEFIQAALFCFAALFPVLNPFGTAVIFVSFTKGLSKKAIHRLALRVAFNTFILLLVVLLVGTWILKIFGISVPIVQVAGGLVVAYIAWSMLQKPSDDIDKKRADASDYDDKKINELAFFPLTMPFTAGPGAMAVTLAVSAHEMGHNSLIRIASGQVAAIAGILLSAIVVFICYGYADRLTKRLGATGERVIMRIFSFINFCIGLEIVWHGVQALLGL